MHERLQQFLSAENLSQSQFADSIGVARASISHILNGRNKPGFDFILNMSKHFPTLNIEWLITGKGKMYKDTQHSASPLPQPHTETVTPPSELFSDKEEEQIPVIPSIPKQISDSQKDISAPKAQLQVAPSPASKGRSISKIVIFYDDNTYQELK